MVQYPPRVDNIKLPERAHILVVQNAALLDRPVGVLEEVTPSKLPGGRYRLRVVIEGVHPGAHPSGHQAEKAAPRTDVQKALARKVVDLQHLLERLFGLE